MMSEMFYLLAEGRSEFAPWILGYLDPGSGSMLFQILIAGLLSGLFCARSSYQKLRDTVFRNPGRA